MKLIVGLLMKSAHGTALNNKTDKFRSIYITYEDKLSREFLWMSYKLI